MKDNEIKLTLYGQAAFEVLSSAKDPDMALLYVYTCAKGGTSPRKDAAAALAFDPVRLDKSADLLVMYGLAAVPGKAAAPTQTEPDHADIAQERETNSAFQGLCSYYEALKGDILRKNELLTLYNAYSALNLPAEVLILLINYCKSIERLSPREIEKQAYFWHDHGIDTYEKAEEYLSWQREKRSRTYAIARILGIQERKLSPTERKYIESWSALPVEDEVISEAYDRTVVRTGKLGWGYMDAILKNWSEKNVRTVQDIDSLDKNFSTPQQASSPGGGRRPQSAEAIVLDAFNEKRRRRETELKKRLTEISALDSSFAGIEKELKVCASKIARTSGSEKQDLINRRDELMQERAEVLQNTGKPASYLDNLPDCPICGDHGYIGTKMCECFKRECEKYKQSPVGIS